SEFGERLSERNPRRGAVHHHLQGPFGRTECSHAVMNAAGSEPGLGYRETLAFTTEECCRRHPDALETHDAVPVLVLPAEHRGGPVDCDTRRVRRNDDHRLLPVPLRPGLGLSHDDEEPAPDVRGPA